MDELDSDDCALTQNGRSAKRDIVQFVPFRRFVKKNVVMSAYEQERLQYLLAKEVLAEVPAQVVSYMKSMNIAPRPPQVAFPDTPANIGIPQQISMQDNNSYSQVSAGALPYPTISPPYPTYAPANPPAYSEAVNAIGMNNIDSRFQQMNVKTSAPFSYN